MNCIELRRAAGASAQDLDAALSAHANECRSCAAFLEDMLAMDATLEAAVRVPVAPEVIERLVAGRRRPAALRQPVLFALAAGMLMAIGLATGLWLGQGSSADPLASELLAHIHHERLLLQGEQPTLDLKRVRNVMQQGRVTLTGEIGAVHHAGLCQFRGHQVTHLVVEGKAGPVTVLLLPDETVTRQMPVDEEGFKGVIIPFGKGSIAIVGTPDDDLEQLQNRFTQAVRWDI